MVASTFKPLVVACISARREVSPEARREDIVLKALSCLNSQSILSPINEMQITYQRASKLDEDICVREDGKETDVLGRIGDDLLLEPVAAFGALATNGGVTD